MAKFKGFYAETTKGALVWVANKGHLEDGRPAFKIIICKIIGHEGWSGGSRPVISHKGATGWMAKEKIAKRVRFGD